MNSARIHRGVKRILAWLWLATLLLRPAAAALVEEKFNVLETRTGTYTNVTVTKKTKAWIFILHAGGMVNIKIADLAPAVQQELGYATAPPKAETSGVSVPTKPTLASLELPQVKQLDQAWRKLATTGFQQIIADQTLLYAALGVVVPVYLFFCYCGMLICWKAHSAPGILIWLPVLQLFPLLRAAGMSRLWFLAFLVPVLNVLAQIVWYVNIVKARGKSLWVALLLLLPLTGPFAFLYLAFSSAAPVEIKNNLPLALETA